MHCGSIRRAPYESQFSGRAPSSQSAWTVSSGIVPLLRVADTVANCRLPFPALTVASERRTVLRYSIPRCGLTAKSSTKSSWGKTVKRAAWRSPRHASGIGNAVSGTGVTGSTPCATKTTSSDAWITCTGTRASTSSCRACAIGNGHHFIVSSVKWKAIPYDLPRLLRELKELGPCSRLKVCYEAGPTGFGLQRFLQERHVECVVVAPSLVPVQSGLRVKTDRRDARKLAHFLRSGDLTAIWVPDEQGHRRTRLGLGAGASGAEPAGVSRGSARDRGRPGRRDWKL